MNAITEKLQGWKIVSSSALTIGLLLLIVIIANGFNEPTMRLAIRITARTSCVLFLAAFIASSLRRFNSGVVAKWLRANRRYLGLSMAVSHGFHAIAIISLAILTSDNYLYENHGGNLGYLFIFAMTITSFNPTAKLLGNWGWQILHTVGMYYLWLAFIYTFALRLNESIFIYLPFVVLLAIALVIRLVSLTIKRTKTNKTL